MYCILAGNDLKLLWKNEGFIFYFFSKCFSATCISYSSNEKYKQTKCTEYNEGQ